MRGGARMYAHGGLEHVYPSVRRIAAVVRNADTPATPALACGPSAGEGSSTAGSGTDGTAGSSREDLAVQAPSVLQISAFSPASGAVASELTITGGGFTGATAVWIGS